MAKDRTREFFSTVEALQTSDSSSAAQALVPPRRQPLAFAKQAASISKQIHTTHMKLATLSQQLRKSKGLFRNSSDDINKLTYAIKADVTFLNRQLEVLQECSKGPKRGGTQTQQHHSQVVGQLQKGLLSATKGFQGVLATRSVTMKSQNDRRGRFGLERSNVLGRPRDVYKMAAPAGQNGDDQGDTAAEESVFNLTQTRLVVREANHLQARANAVADMETHINDLGSIFVRLNTMVLEQGQQIERLDDNVSIAQENTEKASGELLKYLDSVSGNRMLVAKVFGILLMFIVFFVTFMA